MVAGSACRSGGGGSRGLYGFGACAARETQLGAGADRRSDRIFLLDGGILRQHDFLAGTPVPPIFGRSIGNDQRAGSQQLKLLSLAATSCFATCDLCESFEIFAA